MPGRQATDEAIDDRLPGALTIEMIEQHDAAPPPTDPAHLARHRHRVRNHVHHIRRIDCVDALVGECQTRGVHPAQSDAVDPAALETRLRAFEHRRRHVYRKHTTVGRVVKGAETRADADFQNRLAGARCEARYRAAAPVLEQHAIDHVVQRREPLVDRLDGSRSDPWHRRESSARNGASINRNGGERMTFLDALATQRWDDHRYYHHSRINQSLHLLSALSFICAYALIFVNPFSAVMIGWLLAMPSRQIGHFFFEPTGYDDANRATHEHKEQIKVGYNLHRKVVLMSIWLLCAAAAGDRSDPVRDGRGSFELGELCEQCRRAVAAARRRALVFRTVHLFFLRDVQTGLVWLTKILTDPFHDVLLSYKSPIHVMRGELFDPIVQRADGLTTPSTSPTFALRASPE